MSSIIYHNFQNINKLYFWHGFGIIVSVKTTGK